MNNHANQYAVALHKVSFGMLSFFLLVASAAAQVPVTTTNGGTTGTIPIFTSNTNVENSMIYQASGNVGIGTTAPGSLLDVHGPAQIGIDNWDTQVSSPVQVLRLYANGISGVAPYSAFNFNTVAGYNSSNKLEINSWDYINGGTAALFTLQGNGNVGIGTTSPSSLLTLQTNSSSSTAGIRLLGSTHPSDVSYWDENQLAMQYNGTYTNLLNSVGNSYLNASGGNVGIGTTSPQATLDVNGAVRISGSGAALTFPDGSSLSSASALNQLGLNGGGTPAITQSNGNVGIGTTAPVAPLQVNGVIFANAGTSNSIEVGTTWAANDVYNIIGSNGYWGFRTNTSNAFGLDTYNSGSPINALTVLQNGDVGIGTTTPQASLDVKGAVRISGSGAGLTFPDGSVQSTAYTGTCPSTGGDYAESVDVEGDKKSYEPGDVMVLASGSNFDVAKSSEPYSTLVAGIYSTKPGYVGRRQTTSPKLSTMEIPMAMVGIVPTKVTSENGPIQRGDLLVTASRAGYAMKGTDRNRMMGAVVGKAMGSLDSGSGIIEVLVSLQ